MDPKPKVGSVMGEAEPQHQCFMFIFISFQSGAVQQQVDLMSLMLRRPLTQSTWLETVLQLNAAALTVAVLASGQ